MMQIHKELVKKMSLIFFLLGAVVILGCTNTDGNVLTGGVLVVDGVREWVGCTETDQELGSGRSPFKAGTATVQFIQSRGLGVETLTKSDVCLSSRNLREFHCIGKKMYQEEVDCESFGKSFKRSNTCQNNVCVPP